MHRIRVYHSRSSRPLEGRIDEITPRVECVSLRLATDAGTAVKGLVDGDKTEPPAPSA